jgi:signal transduction histidine kinase
VENAARFLEADGGRTGLAVPAPVPGGTVMISDAYWSRGQWQERHARWELGQGIPGFLLESEFSYIANDYRDDRLGDPSLITDYDVRRALCVPIKNMDETLLGFFELLRGPGGPAFTWQDAAFLESLSNTTAVAIHNAQLLKSLEIKNEQIQALSANHVKRLEVERTHIARELHDEAGQVLIGIKLGLQVLGRTVPSDPPQLREELDRLRDLVNKSTVQIKDLARRLRPPILDQLGLNVTLRQMAADFTHRTGVPIDCDLEELPERLPADTETALYRIAQEALTNAARYAAAHRVQFALRRDGTSLQFRMQDDGVGFNQAAMGAGLGLLGMRERADMLNAQFSLLTNPGEGTRITITIPYDNGTDHPR